MARLIRGLRSDPDAEFAMFDGVAASNTHTYRIGAWPIPGTSSPDGTRLALGVVENGTNVWIKQLDAGPFTKMTFEGDNSRPSWSPDGHSVLFLSNRPFPTEQARWQISIGGGSEPLWSHSGREVFFKSQGFLVKADILPGEAFSAGQLTRLFPVAEYAV